MSLRYAAMFLSVLLFPALSSAEGLIKRQHRANKEIIQKQRESNRKRKEELLAQMRNYMNTINGLLEEDGTEIITPVKPDDIENMEDMNRFHDKDKKDIPDYYIYPVDGKISSKYGTRNDPFSNKQRFHSGLDIAAKTGTPVYAAADGTVNRSDFNNGGYGNLIVLDHGNTISTWYGHLNERLVAKNQKIKKGELIGKVGSTGNSTGPHLHFEVRKGADTLDPENFLK